MKDVCGMDKAKERKNEFTDIPIRVSKGQWNIIIDSGW